MASMIPSSSHLDCFSSTFVTTSPSSLGEGLWMLWEALCSLLLAVVSLPIHCNIRLDKMWRLLRLVSEKITAKLSRLPVEIAMEKPQWLLSNTEAVSLHGLVRRLSLDAIGHSYRKTL